MFATGFITLKLNKSEKKFQEYTSIDQLTYDEVYGVYTDWMWEQKTVSEVSIADL